MNDPRRLVEGEGTGLERLLVDAVRRERPAQQLRARMMPDLGLESAAGSGAGPLVAATKTGASAWWAAGIVVGVAVAAAAVAGPIASRLSERAAPEAKPGEVAPQVAKSAATPAEAIPALAPPATDSRHDRESALAEEIRLLDAARTSVSGQRARQALATLDTYFANHGDGALEPEARALQIEALAAAGRLHEAGRAAREFLRRHSAGPLSDRVRPHAARF